MDAFFQNALALLRDFWPYISWIALVVLPLVASAHCILYKRDTRATIGWVGLIRWSRWRAAVLVRCHGGQSHPLVALLREGQLKAEPPASQQIHGRSPSFLAPAWRMVYKKSSLRSARSTPWGVCNGRRF